MSEIHNFPNLAIIQKDYEALAGFSRENNSQPKRGTQTSQSWNTGFIYSFSTEFEREMYLVNLKRGDIDEAISWLKNEKSAGVENRGEMLDFMESKKDEIDTIRFNVAQKLKKTKWVIDALMPNILSPINPEMEQKLFAEGLRNYLQGLDQEKLDGLKNVPIQVDEKLYEKYRRYYDHPEIESGEPLVGISSYGIKSKDIYLGYSKTSLDQTLKSQKVEHLLEKNANPILSPIDSYDGDKLALDTFTILSSEQQIKILQDIAAKLGYTIKPNLSQAETSVLRRAFSMHYGNQELKKVFPEDWDIKVRENLAKSLQRINEKLKTFGYTLGLETGYRSLDEQRMIKTNHARTFGEEVAKKLYADIGKSAHHTGGAMDMILLDASGKKVNLSIGDNSPKTKGLLYGEELLAKGGVISPKDMEAIQGRRVLFHVMTGAGFTPLLSEYWHFGWGDRLSRYIQSLQEGHMIPAQYVNMSEN